MLSLERSLTSEQLATKHKIASLVSEIYPDADGFKAFSRVNDVVLELSTALESAELTVIVGAPELFTSMKLSLARALRIPTFTDGEISAGIIERNGPHADNTYQATFPEGAQIFRSRNFLNCGFALKNKVQTILCLPVDPDALGYMLSEQGLSQFLGAIVPAAPIAATETAVPEEVSQPETDGAPQSNEPVVKTAEEVRFVAVKPENKKHTRPVSVAIAAVMAILISFVAFGIYDFRKDSKIIHTLPVMNTVTESEAPVFSTQELSVTVTTNLMENIGPTGPGEEDADSFWNYYGGCFIDDFVMPEEDFSDLSLSQEELTEIIETQTKDVDTTTLTTLVSTTRMTTVTTVTSTKVPTTRTTTATTTATTTTTRKPTTTKKTTTATTARKTTTTTKKPTTTTKKTTTAEKTTVATTASSGSFVFTVYGYGHGVGMSQEGAMQMARDGYTYDEIVLHYFPGTTLVADSETPTTVLYGSKEIDIVTYLCRTVKAEIGSGSPYESLKAQACTAYTYARYYKFNTSSGKHAYSSSFDYKGTQVEKAVLDFLNMSSAEDTPQAYYIGYKGKTAFTPYFASCAGKTASAESVWGGSSYPYLKGGVSSSEKVSKTTVTVSAADMKKYILKYKSSIKLSDNPAEWLEVVSHDSAVSKSCGYVTTIRVGDITMRGNNFRASVLGYSKIRSHCFSVTYVE